MFRVNALNDSSRGGSVTECKASGFGRSQRSAALTSDLSLRASTAQARALCLGRFQGTPESGPVKAGSVSFDMAITFSCTSLNRCVTVESSWSALASLRPLSRRVLTLHGHTLQHRGFLVHHLTLTGGVGNLKVALPITHVEIDHCFGTAGSHQYG
jgi:hypothetical protein